MRSMGARKVGVAGAWLVCAGVALLWGTARTRAGGPAEKKAEGPPCRVLADDRLEEPVGTITGEFTRRTGLPVAIELKPIEQLDALVEKGQLDCDVVLAMAPDKEKPGPVGSLPGASKVAWKHPGGQPVFAVVLTKHAQAEPLAKFFGGPTGHRLWSESKAGFTMTTGKTHAEAFQWVTDHRVAHTYRFTAMRMLRECGGITKGLCIDIGCGPGNLDVELARRSELKIIGLDIDPDMRKPFEKRMRKEGLSDRVSFVEGDAQKLPFPDDYADLIVSRGTLTFIPDIGKCLREVDRVLKPTGVAFLGGRYIYTPRQYKISTEKLREIVRQTGIAGAQVIDSRGQWVKIVGPQAPQAAKQVQTGPHLLVHRCLADYYITEGDCLVLCGSDGGLEQGLQRGFVEMTKMKMVALYPKEEVAEAAKKRIAEAGQADRIACKVGTVHDLPFDAASFDMVVGVGPILLWGDREQGMKEIHRVLREGGAALVGGKFLHMPDWRKVSSNVLRQSAANTGIPGIRVIDNMGQWVEIRKGIKDRGLRD